MALKDMENLHQLYRDLQVAKQLGYKRLASALATTLLTSAHGLIGECMGAELIAKAASAAKEDMPPDEVRLLLLIVTAPNESFETVTKGLQRDLDAKLAKEREASQEPAQTTTEERETTAG
jgi:hypothetical protein